MHASCLPAVPANAWVAIPRSLWVEQVRPMDRRLHFRFLPAQPHLRSCLQLAAVCPKSSDCFCWVLHTVFKGQGPLLAELDCSGCMLLGPVSAVQFPELAIPNLGWGGAADDMFKETAVSASCRARLALLHGSLLASVGMF